MREKKRLLVGLVAVVTVGITLAACATIINGTNQSISIASQPTGAQVFVDGVPMGVTPVAPDLSRKDKHMIRVELDGYDSYELQLTRGVSGWIAGNIIFGGLIGLAIDAISGGMYKLSPNEVVAVLNQESTAMLYESGEVLVVRIVMKADPSWEHIGDMTPAVR